MTWLSGRDAQVWIACELQKTKQKTKKTKKQKTKKKRDKLILSSYPTFE
jgi:hypothetical protein